VLPPRTTESTGTIGQQSGDIPQIASKPRRQRQIRMAANSKGK